MKRFLKMTALLLAIAILTLSIVGCGASRASQDAKQDLSQSTHVLVVYFSWSGHLESMSGWVADETGGDIIRVLAKEEYPESYNDTADRAKKGKGRRRASRNQRGTDRRAACQIRHGFLGLSGVVV